MAQNKTKSYIQQMECAVCLEIFRNPRILPCTNGAHTVCKSCLEQLVNGTIIMCPLCREIHDVPHNGVEGFISNIMAVSIIDSLCKGCRKTEPELCCEHCQKVVCQTCRASHMFKGATEWLGNLDSKCQKAIESSDIENHPQVQAFYAEIDGTVDSLHKKLDERKEELKDGVRRSLDESLKEWKRNFDEAIKEAQQYMDVIRIKPEDEYDETITVEEMTDIKVQCEEKMLRLDTSMNHQFPNISELDLQLDTSAVLSAMRYFGTGKKMTTSVLRYGAPRVIGTYGSYPGEFDRPTDVAVCPATGHILVADPNKNQRIQVLDRNLGHITDITLTDQCELINWPGRVVVNSKGDVIVADRDSNSVYVYSRARFYAPQQLTNVTIREPRGLAVDTQDNIYVCDAVTHCILVLQQTGKLLATFGGYGEGSGKFSKPPWFIALCVDHIYVSDQGGYVHQFTKSGTFVRRLDPALVGCAGGLAVLGNFDLVIVDKKGPIKVVRDDNVVCQVGECGDQPFHLDNPQGIAVTKTSQIIVANWGHSNILIYDLQ